MTHFSGERSDISDCNSIALISINIYMEDLSRETISSNASLENVTQETSLIDLTHVDKNDNSEMADDDTSTSRIVAQNPTMNKSVIKFLKEIRGLGHFPPCFFNEYWYWDMNAEC